MISTIVLMGTLVTLLMVQDGQSWGRAETNVRQKMKAAIEQRNEKMMLTILGCAVAVGLVANVVKKTMNGGTENEKRERRGNYADHCELCAGCSLPGPGYYPRLMKMYPGFAGK